MWRCKMLKKIKKLFFDRTTKYVKRKNLYRKQICYRTCREISYIKESQILVKVFKEINDKIENSVIIGVRQYYFYRIKN